MLVEGGAFVGCVEGLAGAQSHSTDCWDRLKQQRDMAWPVKAMFHSVGSMRAHTVPGDAAAFCLKRRS